MTPNTVAFRSTRVLVRALVLAAGAALAATASAASAADEAYMLDAALWRGEVAGSTNGHWPADGWLRLTLGLSAIEVRATDAGDAHDRQDAYFLRVPGVAVVPGVRRSYRMTPAVAQPRLDRESQLMLGRTPFGFTASDADGALSYTIRYAGEDHVYVLGRAGEATAVRAVADIDGDTQPDFIVDVGEQTYLLLSRPAVPGRNAPTAELWAARESR